MQVRNGFQLYPAWPHTTKNHSGLAEEVPLTDAISMAQYSREVRRSRVGNREDKVRGRRETNRQRVT